MDIKVDFGKKIKEIRVSQKLSQENLAHLAKVNRTYVSDIEKGSRNVSITIVEKLADALNVKISDLFKF